MRTRGHLDAIAWTRYEQLNCAIVEEVFGEGATGQPVYLDLEPDVLARIAECMGESAATEPDELLCEVVRATLPDPDDRDGLFSTHTAQVVLWGLEDNSKPPPCIGLLAVFSLVAERMKQTKEFAGSNYYGRLLEALNIDRKFHDRVGRDFRRETPLLWSALNRWLEDSNGRRGLPTAVAFDRRRFIGLPLSQALVRAQDRTKLPILFTQLGLQPGQRVSVQAMQELLSEWIPDSQVTQSLKRLWSKHPNRERISGVVCAELEGWDGALPNEFSLVEHKSEDHLLLAAELRAYPRAAIDLLLLVRYADRWAARSPILSADVSGAAMTALAPLGDAMRFERIPGTSWQSLEPGHLVSYPELLIANISLEVPVTSAKCARRARRLVLLKRHESEHLFIEARRAELLETYLILAASELTGSVREVLQSSARKGWRELNYKTLPGLPAGWSAFQNVQLERIATISTDDLTPLRPIARTHLALGGGLPLPGMNVWHSDLLPELRVVVDELNTSDVVCVRAVPSRYLDGTEPTDVSLGEVEGAGVVELSGIPELRDGDFRIVVACPLTGQTVATAGLRVRSGSWPRRLEEGEDTRIGHVLLNESYLSPFARRVAEDSQPTKILGALIETVTRAQRSKRAEARMPLPIQPGGVVEDVEEEGWDPTESSSERGAVDLPVCFTRAHHHWLCALRRGSEPVYSICKDCGREKWWDPPKRKRPSKAGARNAVTRDSTASSSRHRALPDVSESSRADMNLVLDALSYARVGSWRSLHTVTARIDDAPWFAHEATRRLEALGHIQLEIEGRSLAPRRWAIAPPTVVSPESGPCFLAGRRSNRLVRAVADVVSGELSGDVCVVPQPDGPDVIELHGLGSDELALLVDEINEYRGQELGLSIHPASQIAALLPPLSRVRMSLPELTTSASRIDRLDLDSGRWVPVDRMDHPGAYRLRSRPWVYAVVPTTDVGTRHTVVADVRLAKHLAARDASLALVGYDEPCRTLLASAGAPLPGLLERAAVLCSGRLPTRRSDGTLAYERVPREIAEAIWEACTIGD